MPPLAVPPITAVSISVDQSRSLSIFRLVIPLRLARRKADSLTGSALAGNQRRSDPRQAVGRGAVGTGGAGGGTAATPVGTLSAPG